MVALCSPWRLYIGRYEDSKEFCVFVIVAGKFNSQVGNSSIRPITGSHGEKTENENGRQLIGFATFNNFRVINTVFPHKTT